MPLDPSLRFLIADPNPGMRRITSTMLRDLGAANVFEVLDGKAAMETIINERIDCVVSESALPQLSGVDLLAKLRAEVAFQDMPFLILTSDASQDNIIRAAQSGVSAYLVRPISGFKLGQKIEEAFRGAGRQAMITFGQPSGQAEGQPESHRGSRVQHVIKQKSILTYFQPLVSLRENTVVGFEAYSRGLIRQTDEVIPADELFTLAMAENVSARLDEVCREKALANFKPLHRSSKRRLLTMNLNALGAYMGDLDVEHLAATCAESEIDPRNVVLELSETEIEDIDAAYRLVERLKKAGFLVAFDNVGRRRLPFDVIVAVQPDMVKLDRALVRDVDREHHKRLLVKSAVNVCGKIGAAVAAMGVERVEEVVACLESGVELFQGFYFSQPAEGKDLLSLHAERIEEALAAYSRTAGERIAGNRALFENAHRIMDELLDRLVRTDAAGFDPALHEFLASRQEMDSVWILDSAGVQVSGFMHNHLNVPERKRWLTPVRAGGANHAASEYFQFARAGYDRFVSESFCSPLSGNLCKTLCRSFQNSAGARFILCLELVVDS